MAVHTSKAIWVKAYVDDGVADMVIHLNSMDGVLTHTSCQGSTDGAEPYLPYVQVSWEDDAAKARILEHYDLEAHEGNSNWAYAHPRSAGAPSPLVEQVPPLGADEMAGIVRGLVEAAQGKFRSLDDIHKDLEAGAPSPGTEGENRLKRADERIMQYENDEASVCPEDVGFVEYIGVLQSKLALLESERYRLRTALKEFRHNAGTMGVLSFAVYVSKTCDKLLAGAPSPGTEGE